MHRRVLLTIMLVLVGATGSIAQAPSRTHTYYVAADEVTWDYAPTGMDQIRGIPMDSARPGLRLPGRFRTAVKKAVYREYTDASFKTLKPRPAEWEHLGMLGPLLRGEVGDTIQVIFRNNATHPYSMHPHGVFYNKDSEGTPYRDGTEGADKADDAVPPGGTHTYVWAIPERAGPGPDDGSSVMWMYHSHVEEGKDLAAGLMGPIIVTAKGKARPDGRPVDVDREFVITFGSIPEGMSQYARENVSAQMPWANADSVVADARWFNNENFFDSINGYIWGNLPGLTMEQGERVRWYVMANTNEADFHTPHWHGNTVLVHGMRMDIIHLEPMMMTVADMVPDDPGIWLFHCHLKIHLENGMAARYVVLPRGDQAKRLALTSAAAPLLAKASPAAALPAGWHVRPDRPDVRPDQVRLVAMGEGYHAATAQAAVFYDPTRLAQGSYRAQATFTQTAPTMHPEAYGLLFGGHDLENSRESYLYFVIRQDGEYLIKHRSGSELHTLVDWTPSPAIRVGAANQLQVDVRQDDVRFLVNGQLVTALRRDARFPTDGIVGLRINHQLDVHVAGFGLEPLSVGATMK